MMTIEEQMELLPLFEAVLNDGQPGITAMGFVNAPAHKSNWQAFAEMKDAGEIKGYKQNLAGILMMADQEIYRGKYKVKFSPDTIQDLLHKFMSDKITDVTNIEHKQSTENRKSYLLEIWTVIDPETDKIKTHFGIDATPGSVAAIYHVTDENIFKMALNREINGFSIEGYFDDVYKKFDALVESNEEKNNSLNMSVKDLFKQLFAETKAEIEKDMKKFMEVSTVKGEVLSIDEESKAVLINGEVAPDGEYETVEGKIAVVKDGVLVEIKEKVEAPAAEVVEEMNEQSFRAELANFAQMFKDLMKSQNDDHLKAIDLLKKEHASEISKFKSELSALHAKFAAPASNGPESKQFSAEEKVEERPWLEKLKRIKSY